MKKIILITMLMITVFANGNNAVKNEISSIKIELNLTWDNGDPVVGARVYNHIPNVFLGETNKEGVLVFKAEVETIIRMVEPQYGRQQNLRQVTEVDIKNAKGIVRWVEGWTSI